MFRVGPAEQSLEASGDTLVTLDPAGTVLPVWSTNHAALELTIHAVTSSRTLLLHPARTYVGLKTARAFVDKGTPIDVELVIVDVDTTAEITLARMEWKYTGGRPSEQALDPETCAADADSAGRARCAFPTIRGGTYRLLATVRDARAGRTRPRSGCG